jgi:hypothetical protein
LRCKKDASRAEIRAGRRGHNLRLGLYVRVLMGVFGGNGLENVQKPRVLLEGVWSRWELGGCANGELSGGRIGGQKAEKMSTGSRRIREYILQKSVMLAESSPIAPRSKSHTMCEFPGKVVNGRRKHRLRGLAASQRPRQPTAAIVYVRGNEISRVKIQCRRANSAAAATSKYIYRFRH